MSILFPIFYLDDQRTGKVIALRSTDYVLAGALASLYVLWRTDVRTFFKAFLANLVFIALAALGILAASNLSGAYAVIAAVMALGVLGAEQSRLMIRYVVEHHADHGWGVTPG